MGIKLPIRAGSCNLDNRNGNEIYLKVGGSLAVCEMSRFQSPGKLGTFCCAYFSFIPMLKSSSVLKEASLIWKVGRRSVPWYYPRPKQLHPIRLDDGYDGNVGCPAWHCRYWIQ